MAQHTYRFMEVASLSEFDRELSEYEKPGFVGVCEETGSMVATDPEDGWQNWPKAPKDPLKRVAYALDHYCVDGQTVMMHEGATHRHVLEES